MLCSKQLSYVLVLMMGSVMFGFIIGYPGMALASMKLEFGNSFNFDKETFMVKTYNVVSPLASIVGSMFFFYLFNVFPHRRVICIMNIAIGVIWLLPLATSGKTFWVAIMTQAFLGFINGGYCVIIPVYIVELSPSDVVNFYGTLHQVGVALAIVMFNILGAFVQWRVFSYIAAVWSFIFAGLIWLIPESPQSKNIIEKVSYRNESLFQTKYAFKLMTVIVLMIFQQICGINAILSNLTEIMSSSGLDLNQNLQSAISTSAQLIAVVVSAYIVDAIGKRAIWSFACIGISMCLLVYALNMKFSWGNWLPTLCIFVYMLFFGLAVGPIPWYIAPTLFPSGVSLLAQCLITVANMAFSFAVVFLFPVMNNGIGEFGTMLAFMAVTIVAAIFGAWAIPVESEQDGEGISLM